VADFQYQTEPLDENEDVLGVFYGNRGQWGAQFIVTNRRLLLGPLDVGLAKDILSFGLGKAAGIDFVKSVLERYAPTQPRTIWVQHVLGVQPTNGPSLFKAPGLRISTATQEQIELRIVHKPTALNIAGANIGARDEAVRVLREAVASAKQASG
jgi:hypothetical protein